MSMRAACLVLFANLMAACSSGDGPAAPSAAPDAALLDTAPRCRISDETPLEPSDGSACGDVPVSIIQETCTGTICHHAGPTPAGGLDLESPCIADRLVGVVSTCKGRQLIDPSDIGRSFVLDKLEHDPPDCNGETMPFDGHLAPDALACMELWVQAVARASR